MAAKHTTGYDEYLETLVRLKEQKKPARVSDLAHELKVSKASVSGMLRKLSTDGMISYSSYSIPELTTKGEQAGRTILRKHRLIHMWLNIIGVKKDNIHKEACALEHVISDEVESRLKTTMKKRILISLSSLKEGMKGKITKFETDQKTAQRLRDMGLTEGTIITLRRVAPFKGPLELSVRGSRLAVGRRVALKILVRWAG